ncbi:atlastin-like [Sitodiplosis mosellana]|uniref:atlastin-like n=1 Tax=Sitodiplosis mosellana TaxID=263140 RepID=UPI002444D85E|nr:atlastin-like [Sitodiplosis mosellana]
MESTSTNSAPESNSARAVQIICPENHKFKINLDEFNKIPNLNDMKDRHVVVVSIAGAFRKGKSFLLNFFLKYLNAQYKKHDVSDWLGENGNMDELSGFKWRGGRKPETTGIWMWSEVFTHDFSDGEKVAIILLDTQGIFDHQSSWRDCTATFALSMLLASVQCYNVMQNVQEDDLENLEMFTEYGRLALEQSREKPFQKLLFIIRDWPNAFETSYGWNGQQVIDEILSEDDGQTSENRKLRDRIKSSFKEVKAFLMPHPGKDVAQSGKFTVKLQQIDPEFVKYLKELVPALFAPENLVVKKINNESVRVGDLVQYLQAYANLFNDNKLPEPKTILTATAEVNNSIFHGECLHFYEVSMQKEMEKASPYYTDSELQDIHQKLKDETMKKFLEKPKLGGDQLASTFFNQLEGEVAQKLLFFQRENDMKQNNAIIQEKADKLNKVAEELKDRIESLENQKDNLSSEIYEERLRHLEKEFNTTHNYTLRDQLKATFENNMMNQIGNSHLNDTDLMNSFHEVKASILRDFDSSKKGDNDISGSVRQKLERDMDNALFGIKRWNESNKLPPPHAMVVLYYNVWLWIH